MPCNQRSQLPTNSPIEKLLGDLFKAKLSNGVNREKLTTLTRIYFVMIHIYLTT